MGIFVKSKGYSIDDVPVANNIGTRRLVITITS